MHTDKPQRPDINRRYFSVTAALAGLVLLCTQPACFKDEPGIPSGIFNIQEPTITLSLDGQTRSELQVRATIDTPGNLAIIRHGFVWDAQALNPDVSLPTIIEHTSQAPASFTDTIRGLAVYSTYYIRAFVETRDGITYSESKSFTTAYPWLQIPAMPANARSGAAGFSIGGKGYVGTGYYYEHPITLYLNDFWEYDPATKAWTQKADFAGGPRIDAVGFGIGDKGYIGTGYSSSRLADFWEYDPTGNTWTPKADFAGGPRSEAVGFSIGDKGYIGTGDDGLSGPDSYLGDFWEYDPALDLWTQRADVVSICGSTSSVGFSIGARGYIGTGDICQGLDIQVKSKLFYEYDPAQDTWTSKADCPVGLSSAVGIGIGDFGYIGTGIDDNNAPNAAFWRYNPATNSWTDVQALPFRRVDAVGFSIGTKGYVGAGFLGSSIYPNFWEFAEQ